MRNTFLKNVEVVKNYETNEYNLNLTYEEETESTIRTFTYENVPIRLSNEPRFRHYVKIDGIEKRYIDFGFGEVPYPRCGNVREDSVLHKVHNVTVKDLENMLGFPINVIEDAPSSYGVSTLLLNAKAPARESITLITDEEYNERYIDEIVEEESNDSGAYLSPRSGFMINKKISEDIVEEGTSDNVNEESTEETTGGEENAEDQTEL